MNTPTALLIDCPLWYYIEFCRGCQITLVFQYRRRKPFFVWRDFMEIRINGVPLPSPDSYTFGRDVVGEFARNAAGNLVGDLVAVKDMVSVGWKMMSGEDYRRLVGGSQPVFVRLTYLCGEMGQMVTKTMMARPNRARVAYLCGGMWWKDVSCDFVEQ